MTSEVENKGFSNAVFLDILLKHQDDDLVKEFIIEYEMFKEAVDDKLTFDELSEITLYNVLKCKDLMLRFLIDKSLDEEKYKEAIASYSKKVGSDKVKKKLLDYIEFIYKIYQKNTLNLLDKKERSITDYIIEKSDPKRDILKELVEFLDNYLEPNYTEYVLLNLIKYSLKIEFATLYILHVIEDDITLSKERADELYKFIEENLENYISYLYLLDSYDYEPFKENQIETNARIKCYTLMDELTEKFNLEEKDRFAYGAGEIQDTV